jgi:hypothetical protein
VGRKFGIEYFMETVSLRLFRPCIRRADKIRKAVAIALMGGLLFAVGEASLRGQATNPVGTVLWKRSLGEPIWPSAAVGANGAVYVAGVGTLYALDGNSGSNLWKFSTKPCPGQKGTR